ncbi:helicase-related protein [Geodermatophilus sp. Leaf369]|uniref:helicase-related protein n=1 Tax=Geodermatophilus sp. Leaf369 TaxID=1736354 RepID=UPI001910E1AE|nr:helicase-related protein [Geodermatophilus sp. Leaf369]
MFSEAATHFTAWLDRQVTVAGRGDGMDRLGVAPASTFWMGRLATEQEVMSSGLGQRAERLEPCAIGLRVRPTGAAPWHFEVRIQARAWTYEDPKTSSNPNRPWVRSPGIDVPVSVNIDPALPPSPFGGNALGAAFARVGATGLNAEVRVDIESWNGAPELVVQLVNSSPAQHAQLEDTHLYETAMQITGLSTVPFELEALPDSFRYDRDVPAYGVNVGVALLPGGGFRTTDTVEVTTRRPEYWTSDRPEPDLTFATLSRDPLPPLEALVQALGDYHSDRWGPLLDEHPEWDQPMRDEAAEARLTAGREIGRLQRGLQLLISDTTVRRAFQLMNDAIAHSAAGKYDSWRPFQVGFLLGALAFLVDEEEADIVDTVWFATGGGKTETYLGLLVTAALHDRMTGKTSGVTAWSRFPLRLLSLQQTQRFADALAGAELVRRRERIKGAPISLGFLVGSSSTPNRIVKTARPETADLDPDSPGMPDRFQVLMRCPFCRGNEVGMHFDRLMWRLTHQCANPDCPWPEPALPVYVVDSELYRYLPTVVLGTLDKAASVGMQAAMRGLVGPPIALCTEAMHGYTYTPRSATPTGCLVPDCSAGTRPLPMPADRYAPTLRLQDELHLLRDSLGAVDSHYESLLDHLQDELGSRRAKIVASSATLTGHDHQVDVLYRRSGRVFPTQGPVAGGSFWTRPGPMPLRRFVAVAPRGVTLDHVSDRTLDVLQIAIRRLAQDPGTVCAEAGVDPKHADRLLSYYGTDVIYGSTLYDVEAATRSLTSNTSSQGLQAVQLTGGTDFDEVRAILERLENPEADFDDRIHIVAASSMLSHGVDVARLNVMVMLGLPLSTAEFIQTTARVGRTFPGLVYVLHKIGRERDAAIFRQFGQYVTHGDRFVEAVPITRRSRRVLRLTMPGIVEARRLALMEPASRGRLTTISAVRRYFDDAGIGAADQTAAIAALLGFDGPVDDTLREEIGRWLDNWFTNLNDPAGSRTWPNELGASSPMTSLRDVEVSVPIHD